MDILIIYQFCTLGGVERVILNRAKAFKKHAQDVHISVCYLEDYGALRSFREYIRLNSLDEQINAVLIDDKLFSNLEKYDFVFIIDTPQMFEHTQDAKNIFVECHTPYIQNRQYLKDLPSNVRGILVPSLAFKNILLREFSTLPPVFVLPNLVAEEFFSIPLEKNFIYPKRPLAYLARLDELKNYIEALDIFELFAQDENIMFAIAGNPINLSQRRFLTLLREKGILGKTFLRYGVGFNAVPDFIRLVKSHRGIFISPSLGESFGLSAAEFMSAGIPVLLSDIDAHRELVNMDGQFLYKSHDILSAKNKIVSMLENWDSVSSIITSYAQKFTANPFISSWQEFINHQDVASEINTH